MKLLQYGNAANILNGCQMVTFPYPCHREPEKQVIKQILTILFLILLYID